MAKFEYDAAEMTKLVQDLEKADIFTEENQERLLYAGAEAVTDTIKKSVSASPYNTRQFVDKIKYSKTVKKDKSGVRYVLISPNGKHNDGRGKPRRVAEILFVLNYGRRKQYGEITGDYAWTKGTKNGEKAALEACEEEVKNIYHERGLI